MANYKHFQSGKPDGTANGTATCNEISDNAEAMVDAFLSYGLLSPGWSLDIFVGTGSNEEPDGHDIYDGASLGVSVNRMRLRYTWGTTGGEDGNITSVNVDVTTDTASTWQNYTTRTLTWESDGTMSKMVTTKDSGDA